MDNDSSPSLRAVKDDIRQARDLLRTANRLLVRAATRPTESSLVDAGVRAAVWSADVASDYLHVIASDLEAALVGAEPLPRVELVVTGRKWGEDAGGGFARRALQALALCREARSNADQCNGPRVENAMAWLARAWLETCGYERAAVVRRVMTCGFEGSAFAEELVARVNARMATLEPKTSSRFGGGQ